ncbi:MAG: cohesin domain-containing protein [Bacteroidota bacterium]
MNTYFLIVAKRGLLAFIGLSLIFTSQLMAQCGGGNQGGGYGNGGGSGGFPFGFPVLHAFDPNDITGPPGFGDARYVSVDERMQYTIRFENDPDFATAPAQKVTITLPIDVDLNLFSFRIGNYGFGDFAFTVPSNQVFYSTRLDVSDSLGVLVNFTAGIDVNTNEAFWIFESIDPATGLANTVAPELGFLPVNDTSVNRFNDTATLKGEGYVTFSLVPRAQAVTGDTITEQAGIVFDFNAPIETNIEKHVVDAVAPTSTLNTLAANTDSATALLSWNVVDDTLGSGPGSVDLYVSEDSSAFFLFDQNLPIDTIYPFTGTAGTFYQFFTRSRDNVGNLEAQKSLADGATFIRGNLVEISGAAITLANDTITGVDYTLVSNEGEDFLANVDTFNFKTPEKRPIQIGAFKNNDSNKQEGVDVADVLILAQHILGVSDLTGPYQIIQGDVNLDGNLNLVDLLLTQFFILETNNGFPAYNNPTSLTRIWSFLPSDVVFTDTLTPVPFDTARTYASSESLAGQDFTGLKIGDLNDSWSPSPQRQTTERPIFFVTHDQTVRQGEEIKIPVMVKEFSEVAGYQFTLNWDPRVLDFKGVQDGGLSARFGLQGTTEGYLTILWNEASAQPLFLEDGHIIFELSFEVIGDNESQTTLKIDGNRTPDRAYTHLLSPLEIRGLTGRITVEDQSTNISSDLLSACTFEVAPNPFRQNTKLSFSLPTQSEVVIKIINNLGQTVYTYQQNYEPGEHQIAWDGKNEEGIEVAAGAYYGILEACDQELVMKLQKTE